MHFKTTTMAVIVAALFSSPSAFAEIKECSAADGICSALAIAQERMPSSCTAVYSNEKGDEARITRVNCLFPTADAHTSASLAPKTSLRPEKRPADLGATAAAPTSSLRPRLRSKTSDK